MLELYLILKMAEANKNIEYYFSSELFNGEKGKHCRKDNSMQTDCFDYSGSSYDENLALLSERKRRRRQTIRESDNVDDDNSQRRVKQKIANTNFQKSNSEDDDTNRIYSNTSLSKLENQSLAPRLSIIPISARKSTAASGEKITTLLTFLSSSDDESLLPPPSSLSRRETEHKLSNNIFELPIQQSSEEEGEEDVSDVELSISSRNSSDLLKKRSLPIRENLQLNQQESHIEIVDLCASDNEDEDCCDNDKSKRKERRNDTDVGICYNQGIRTSQRSSSFNVASCCFPRPPSRAAAVSLEPESSVNDFDNEIECWEDDCQGFNKNPRMHILNQRSLRSKTKQNGKGRTIRSARDPAYACNVPAVTERASHNPFQQASKTIWFRASQPSTNLASISCKSRRNDVVGGSGVGVGCFQLKASMSQHADDNNEKGPRSRQNTIKEANKRERSTKKKSKKVATARRSLKKKYWGRGRQKRKGNSFSQNAPGPGYEHHTTAQRRDADFQHVGGAQIFF